MTDQETLTNADPGDEQPNPNSAQVMLNAIDLLLNAKGEDVLDEQGGALTTLDRVKSAMYRNTYVITPQLAPANIAPLSDEERMAHLPIWCKKLAEELQWACATHPSPWLQQALQQARDIGFSLETHARMTANK
ncbi:hypothetical protein KGP36_01635 [Patescibacteria group bacterium]|nr:hypothetical protein [Patescibacteria group bacterium]